MSTTKRSAATSTAALASRRKWLTVTDILEELGVERRTWQEWRARGTAPKCKKLPNGQLRIRVDHYEAWLDGLEGDA